MLKVPNAKIPPNHLLGEERARFIDEATHATFFQPRIQDVVNLMRN
jgi:hypothetical protein